MTAHLPTLSPTARVTPRILRLLAHNPSQFTLQGTNTYLLGSGSRRTLIDTGQGVPAWHRSLAQVLKEEGATVEKCLITHWHHDHLGGVADLLGRLCPAARVWKWDARRRERFESDKERLLAERDVSAEGRQALQREWHDITHTTTFAVEPGMQLKPLHCPGHAADHCAFVVECDDGGEEDGVMFTGDNVLGHGTAVFENYGVYMASLGEMRDALKTERAVLGLPAHGDVIEDLRGRVGEYIEHRAERERQVVGVLRGSPEEGMGSMQVVKLVYKDVPEGLHGPAEGGVRQILEKLEGDGLVRREEEGRWIVKRERAMC